MQTLSTAQRQFFETAVTQYQSDLAGDTSAQAYLTGRGFGPQAAATFRLGVVKTPLVGHEGYRGRLAIPYLTPAGVVNLRFRCLKAHDCAKTVTYVDPKGKKHYCPKYLSLDGMEGNLYNVLDLKKDSPFIGVTEGELDAATVSMALMPCVGVAGVEAWQDHFGRCLEDFDVVYSFTDGDTAGRKFARFLAKEAKARPVSIPQGMDVNKLYMEGGADALRRLIE